VVVGTGVAAGGLRGGRGGGLRTRRVHHRRAHHDHVEWCGVPGVDTGGVAGRSGGPGDTRGRTSVRSTDSDSGGCGDRAASGIGESDARAGGHGGEPGR